VAAPSSDFSSSQLQLYELFTLSGGTKETLRIHHKKPPSFSLSKEQVDGLAKGGKAMLQGNTGYQQLVTDLGGRIDRPQ